MTGFIAILAMLAAQISIAVSENAKEKERDQVAAQAVQEEGGD